MVLPAVTGLVGTVIGGSLSFLGTVLTSRRTAEREEKARLFSEKRKSYASALDLYQTARLETLNEAATRSVRPADFLQHGNARRRQLEVAFNDLIIIGPKSLQPLVPEAMEAFDDLFAEGRKLKRKEDYSTEAMQRLKEKREATQNYTSRLATSMREDLGVPD